MHKNTKIHQNQIVYKACFVEFGDLVFSWQKNISEGKQ